jgi:hypothetical protein
MSVPDKILEPSLIFSAMVEWSTTLIRNLSLLYPQILDKAMLRKKGSTTLRITTFSLKTLSIMAFGIMTLSITIKNRTQYFYAECLC